MARKGEQSESNGTDFELEVAKRLEEITKFQITGMTKKLDSASERTRIPIDKVLTDSL